MVKYVAWATRTGDQPVSEEQDRVVRASAAEQGFRQVLGPAEGWAKDQGWGTAYSYEQFAGARPVWIWEQP